MTRFCRIAVLACWLGLGHGVLAAEFDPADLEFFEKHVRPVLVERCHECHSGQADEPDAGLKLDSRDNILAGGENGPAVVPGDLDASRILRAISYDDVDLQMPPDGKLSDEAIEHLREWVERGAPWPAEASADTPAAKSSEAFDLQERKRSHWAWQPIQAVEPPAVRDASWVRSDIDRFILSKLEQAGIAPAGPADRRTWLRRVTFDLIGLPPTVDEVEAYVADASPDADAKVVDRLLASPHFGERWARHWLDLVRYAETKGHEFDYPVPNAWVYRDYVIRALNADVPYDQFVVEHLAGDLLTTPRLHPTEGFNESIIGTGFWFLGEELHSPVDTRQDQADRFDNRIDVMSKTFLGLTVACARCHDHKFDAISNRDYYALFGFLESSSGRLARFDTIEQDRQIAEELAVVDRATQQKLRSALAGALRPTVERLDEYLLAVAALLADEKLSVEVIAAEKNLDLRTLKAWGRHLSQVGELPSDPFHRLALAIKVSGRVAELPDATAANASCEPATSDRLEIVVDYLRLSDGQWLPDDVSYGVGPRLPGMVNVAEAAGSPRIAFVERAAAEFDRAWDVRTAASGHQIEPGAVGANGVRSGRTLHTPNFTVRGGVYSLVRGAGQVYAAVDQHSLIFGPLHGKLVGTFNTEGAWRWVERDLREYAGHTAHLEFTPAKDATLSVSAVVQAEEPPPLPTDMDAPQLVARIDDGATLSELASAYRSQMEAFVGRLADVNTIGDEQADADARLANWTLEHAALFALDLESPDCGINQLADAQLADRAAVLTKIRPESRLCLAMRDGTGVDEQVFLRGSWKNLGVATPRRGPEALFGDAPIDAGVGSGRLQLARQLTDPASNPLISRVLVNRVWHHLFGRGIVASVDNFGVMGDAPTHAELLDYLATRFVSDGWSLKRLIRDATLSNAYRMASHCSPESEAIDAQNLLLHRMRVRRLEGEAIRDAMLLISGSLDRELFGRSLPVHLNEFMDGRGRPEQSGPLDGANRRSLYTEVRRNFLSPMMLAFDTPIPFSTVGRRSVSNVPAQSLVMLNDPLVHELSERWAKRVCEETSGQLERIDHMYLECFARLPTEAERSRCGAFLGEQDDADAWKDLAHSLWNVKEFVFVH